MEALNKILEAQGTAELASARRFGGISPVVIRELSGVYQPFTKAVKELISNSYDADSSQVALIFSEGLKDLRIEDNGIGMNPVQFVRDYIRIGSGVKHPAKTLSDRLRIGGKGIGFLAPARYCQAVVVETKSGREFQGCRKVDLARDMNLIALSEVAPEIPLTPELLPFITLNECLIDGRPIPATLAGEHIRVEVPIASATSMVVYYTLLAQHLVLEAVIDFERLFALDSSESLERFSNFCDITLRIAQHDEVGQSYCRILLKGLHDFVVQELTQPGRRGARNKDAGPGYERFWWHLGRVTPVKADPSSAEVLPAPIIEAMRQSDMLTLDQVELFSRSYEARLLYRPVFLPSFKMTEEHQDLFHVINEEGVVNNRKVRVIGYLLGHTSAIFPAELRGIQVRVNHVGIGEPTLFGLEQVLTGAARVALTQVTGELNLLEGVDPIEDLNPGREGFYAESPVYRLFREWVVGPEGRLEGPLKRIVDAIVARSEVGSSADHFLKRMKNIRLALIDAAAIIGELSMSYDDVSAGFWEATPNALPLIMSPDTKFRPEGRLNTFTLIMDPDLKQDCRVDFPNRKFHVNARLDIWRRNVAIAGEQFEVTFKSAKNTSLFTAVAPGQRRIFINWEHPTRGAIGDTAFIKHCLATIASRLPQDGLDIYLRLVSHRSS